MHDFMDQVKDCLSQSKPVKVNGFGFNGTNLGQLLSQEDQIVQEIRERAPDFHKRLSIEKIFHRSQMASRRKEKALLEKLQLELDPPPPPLKIQKEESS
jgi:hypothetical protein